MRHMSIHAILISKYRVFAVVIDNVGTAFEVMHDEQILCESEIIATIFINSYCIIYCDCCTLSLQLLFYRHGGHIRNK